MHIGDIRQNTDIGRAKQPKKPSKPKKSEIDFEKKEKPKAKQRKFKVVKMQGKKLASVGK